MKDLGIPAVFDEKDLGISVVFGKKDLGICYCRSKSKRFSVKKPKSKRFVKNVTVLRNNPMASDEDSNSFVQKMAFPAFRRDMFGCPFIPQTPH
ncbi:MAG: hypothetical protein IJT83_00835 [Victivallales bacterium]|nr:hypothetical protein [Victivallales bacterium]